MTKNGTERYEQMRVQQTRQALKQLGKIEMISRQVWHDDGNETALAQLYGETRAWERLAAAIERVNAALERNVMLKSQLEPTQ